MDLNAEALPFTFTFKPAFGFDEGGDLDFFRYVEKLFEDKDYYQAEVKKRRQYLLEL